MSEPFQDGNGRLSRILTTSVTGGGTYSIRHTVDRKTVYFGAGKNAANAAAKCLQLERTKSLVAVAAANPDVVITEKEDRQTLRATAASYIQDALDRNANEAAEQAKLVSREFTANCRKTFVDEVGTEDFYAFHKALKGQGRSDRTVSSKHSRLASWLKFGGIDPKRIPGKPKFEQTLPDVYSPSQTKALRDAANPSMELLITTSLKTRLRDQEWRHVEFSDVNWSEHTLRVRAKPRWGFTVKTWEQRNVPLPDDLIEALREWQEKNEGQSPIFATKNGKPNTKLLAALKGVARR